MCHVPADEYTFKFAERNVIIEFWPTVFDPGED
jgi:hypothetical protein